MPEVGDVIYGEIEAITTRDGDYGEYEVVQLLDEDGGVHSVAIFGTVLKNKFDELSPAAGDRIGFKYLGEKPTKSGGATYKNWQVQIERASVPVGSASDVEAAVGGDAFPTDTDI